MEAATNFLIAAGFTILLLLIVIGIIYWMIKDVNDADL